MSEEISGGTSKLFELNLGSIRLEFVHMKLDRGLLLLSRGCKLNDTPSVS